MIFFRLKRTLNDTTSKDFVYRFQHGLVCIVQVYRGRLCWNVLISWPWSTACFAWTVHARVMMYKLETLSVVRL